MLLAAVADLISDSTVDLSQYLESTDWKEIHEKKIQPVKHRRGRPKGSKNKPRQSLSPRIQIPRAAKQDLSSQPRAAKPATDEDTETDEDMPPVRVRRGRPKGSKRKRPSSPDPLQNSSPSVEPSDDSSPSIEPPRSKKRKLASHIHRKRRLYPPCLLDLESVPILKSTNPGHIALAETKLQEVTSGKRLFGHPLIIPSFEKVLPPYRMPATLCNLFFFNVLFSSNALDTATGKVSIFPVTIFQDEQKSSGFPCLLIHSAHMKTLMWNIYSGCRQLFKNGTFLENLPDICCSYSKPDENLFHALTGFEPYTPVNKDLAYILIPAHWLDVMRHFFVDAQTNTPYDIGHLCRTTFHTIPEMADKFHDDYRCNWAGEERISNVSYMICEPDAVKVFSMARCRAVNNQAMRKGVLWTLRERQISVTLPDYNDLSFAYGVQCWKEQLQMLNTAVVFFTGSFTKSPMHQVGLLAYNDDKPVQSRSECVRGGILDDSKDNILLSNHTRQLRGTLRTQKGADFMTNYFGHEGVYFKSRLTHIQQGKQ